MGIRLNTFVNHSKRNIKNNAQIISLCMSLFVTFSCFGCYDSQEGMPMLCYTLNNKIIQVGDTLILEDCSECQSITVEWGDEIAFYYRERYDYYDHKTKKWKQPRSGHVFRHVYEKPGQYKLTVEVWNTIDPPPSFDPSGGARHAEQSEMITVK